MIRPSRRPSQAQAGAPANRTRLRHHVCEEEVVLKEARLGEVLLQRAHVLGRRPQETHGLHVSDGVVARADRHDRLACRVEDGFASCVSRFNVQSLNEVDCEGRRAALQADTKTTTSLALGPPTLF